MKNNNTQSFQPRRKKFSSKKTPTESYQTPLQNKMPPVIQRHHGKKKKTQKQLSTKTQQIPTKKITSWTIRPQNRSKTLLNSQKKNTIFPTKAHQIPPFPYPRPKKQIQLESSQPPPPTSSSSKFPTKQRPKLPPTIQKTQTINPKKRKEERNPRIQKCREKKKDAPRSEPNGHLHQPPLRSAANLLSDRSIRRIWSGSGRRRRRKFENGKGAHSLHKPYSNVAKPTLFFLTIMR